MTVTVTAEVLCNGLNQCMYTLEPASHYVEVMYQMMPIISIITGV